MATKKAKKTVRKPAPRPKTKARKTAAKAKPGYACEVCGYRLIVDEACGCAEEHVILCCGRPMAKTA
jgi:hypothetical protein